MKNLFAKLTKRFLAADDAARAMQIAGLVRFICLFLQGVILVKAGVPLAIVGQVELVFFVSNFFMFFWQNGANNAMMSWASGQERVQVAGAIFKGMHIHAILGVALMWVIAQFPVDSQFDFIRQDWNLLAILLYVFFTIPSGAIIYAYLVRKQYVAIQWFTGITHLMQIAIVTGTIIAGYSVQEMLWSLAGFAILKWIVVIVTGKFLSTRNSAETGMWAFVAFAMPLVIHAFNGGLMDYVDGWIVSFFYGQETFAVYRYGARELPFNALLIGGLMSGLIHQFSTQASVDSQVLRAETVRIMKLLFPINAALILVSAPIFTLVYNEDFHLSARIFNIYALTLLSRVIMNQVYCYVHHHNWVLTWSTAGEVIINIILSLLLMQWLGILGIPLATVLAYTIQKMFLVYYIRRKFGVRTSEYFPVKQCIWYFAGMILCFVLSEILYF